MAINLLLAFAVATLAVVAAIMLMNRILPDAQRRRQATGDTALTAQQIEPLAFLFRDGVLVNGTTPARLLLDVLPGEGEWQRLMGWIAMRMPESGAALIKELHDKGRAELVSQSERGRLRAVFEDLGDSLVRVTLTDPTSEHSGVMIDSLTLAAMEEEIEMLRSTVDGSPMLAWREDRDGAITWANSAYLNLAEKQAEGQIIWPLPRLIDLPKRSAQPLGPRRAQIEDAGETRWYECHAGEKGEQTVAIALPADAAVRAERSLREFVQTLTKTFADLPIGMAIFNRDRNLQLFNPALVDLTGLSAGFLTARPTLYAFLDRLREGRMVPEPKDYRSWRNQMSTLESASASGHHVEQWSLPGGQTYRVTGRPHPDGAIAFLFEDITSEISLTRKFRADLSLGKEVLNGLDDALAVFAGNGRIAMTNRAYDQLWGDELQGTIGDHLQCWHKTAGESPGLIALRDAVGHASGPAAPRSSVEGAMAGPSGTLLSWTLRFLPGGRIMVRFISAPNVTPALHVDGQTGKANIDGALAGSPLDEMTKVAAS